MVEESLLYIATEDNEEFLGPDSLETIANQIHLSHGPSGPNVEYLLNLSKALHTLNVVDQHVIDLSAIVTDLQNSTAKLNEGTKVVENLNEIVEELVNE